MSLDLTTETSSEPDIWYNQPDITLVNPINMAKVKSKELVLLSHVKALVSMLSVCKGIPVKIHDIAMCNVYTNLARYNSFKMFPSATVLCAIFRCGRMLIKI